MIKKSNLYMTELNRCCFAKYKYLCRNCSYAVILRKKFTVCAAGIAFIVFTFYSYLMLISDGDVATPHHVRRFPVNTTFMVHVRSRHTIHVHPRTSFLDVRNGSRATLRMFGHLLTKKYVMPPFHCHVTTRSLSWIVIGTGMVITENDQWRRQFNRTAMFVCELPLEARLDGNSVVLHGTSGKSAEIHRVGKRIYWGSEGQGFAICLPTLYNVTSPYVVAEWIEMQRLLGVTKIFLYDKYNTSPEVDRVLKYYFSDGYLDMVTWNEPWRTGLYAHAHDTVLNHCLYTLMENFEYIGVYDLDEFLIPLFKTYYDTSHLSASEVKFVKLYPDMMTKIRDTSVHTTAGYSFVRKRFCIPENNLKANDNQSLRALQLVYSTEDTNIKTVHRPAYVTVLSIHAPVEYSTGYKGSIIPVNVSMIYHYRETDSTCTQLDRTLAAYKTAIQNAVSKCFKASDLPFVYL